MKLHHRRTEPEQQRLFTVEEQEGIAVLTFCGETQHLLGMNLAAIDPLWQFFAEQERQPAKVIVLYGAPSVFSPAHMDEVHAKHGLVPAADAPHPDSAMVHHPKVDFMREMHALKRFIETVRHAQAPVVSTVRGETLLSLMGPMLACDFRIAAEDAVLVNRTIDWWFASVGGLPWFLTQALGRRTAAEQIRTPQAIPATRALELGLVDRVVPDDRVLEECLSIARDIASLSRGHRAAIKQASVAVGQNLDEYLVCEQHIFEKTLERSKKWTLERNH